ncbi:hypothetical protein [Nocardioides alcanivorans]|uniref:hypothetical protein n=1 Tax=Nocardioides alcanivorans TaxID=2897352 RepID=UPI001F1D5614|nr:hypothetical protein [Nocardioides alcanivorans]
MRAITLLGGVIGSGALLLELPPTATSAALGMVIAVIGLLFVGVVATGPLWLRVVVTGGSALLVASLWLALETELGADRVNPVVGVLGVAGFALALMLSSSGAYGAGVRERPSPSRGPQPGRLLRPRRAAHRGPGSRAASEETVRIPMPRVASEPALPPRTRPTTPVLPS